MSLFTIDAPVHNGVERFAVSLEFVIVQAHSELEVAVADDQLTGETAEVAAEWARRETRVSGISSSHLLGTQVPCTRLEVLSGFLPKVCETLIESCVHVVAHPGGGTILSARDGGKPLLVVPRIVGPGEHRSDHQQATARDLVGAPEVRGCDDPCHRDSEREDLLGPPPLRLDLASTSLAALLRGLESFTARGRVED